MQRKGQTIFDRPWLLLCEGETDRVCLSRILDAMGTLGKFIVRFPDRGSCGQGGRSKFGPYLDIAVNTSVTFRQNVKAILIVSDNDDDPAASFAEVVTSLKTSNKIAVPAAPFQWAKLPGQPDVFVAMIPRSGAGQLETLCLAAAYSKWNIKQAVDDFAHATHADKWPRNKLEKMKVQSVVASTCKDRPEAGLSNHWKENARYHIPVSDAAFDEVRDFLNTFISQAPV